MQRRVEGWEAARAVKWCDKALKLGLGSAKVGGRRLFGVRVGWALGKALAGLGVGKVASSVERKGTQFGV